MNTLPGESPHAEPERSATPAPSIVPSAPPVGRVTLPKYSAFFETLSTEAAEGTPGWQAALAGLLTLRYLDTWSDAGMSGESIAFNRAGVGNAIQDLPGGAPERALLGGLMEAMAMEADCDLTRIASLLLAYGRALQQRSNWGMAADVYARAYVTSAPLVAQPVHRELAASAALRMGQCYRRMSDASAADEAFRAALALGQMTGDGYTTMKARLGLAGVAADVGNLASADDQLAAIIADCASDVAREARAHAWHDRAHVAQRRGQAIEAIEYAYEAWVASRDAVTRERILADLAGIAAAAGCPDIARDAQALLAETASDRAVRWLSTVRLMELAVQNRRELDFARHRRTLAEVTMPPAVEAEYLYQGALGDVAFGRRAQAIDALRALALMAATERLGDVLFRAEAALAGIVAGTLPAPPSAAPRPADKLAHVAAALAGARPTASVAC